MSATAAARPLAGRAVHIKIRPRTCSVRESREVLRVLKGFGEVISFHNLQYDTFNPAPHTILAIFQTARSASDFIAETPLRMSVAPPPPLRPVASPASHNLPELYHDRDSPEGADNASSQRSGKDFVLNADLSTMDHQAIIQHKSHYWGYPVKPRTFAQQALAKDVPAPGLCMIGAEKMMVNRLVKRNLEKVAKRKTVRQMLEERDEAKATEAAKDWFE